MPRDTTAKSMDKSEKKSFFLGYRKLAASDPCQGLPSSPLTTHPDLPLLTPPPCSRRKENSKERQLFMKKDLGAGKTQPGNKKEKRSSPKKQGYSSCLATSYAQKRSATQTPSRKTHPKRLATAKFFFRTVKTLVPRKSTSPNLCMA